MCEALTRANADDARIIAKLLTQMTGLEESPDKVAAQVAAICRRDDMLLLVRRHNSSIVGMVTGTLCIHVSPAFSPYLQLEAMVVDEALRRQGIGRELVLRMEAWAEQHACRYITLVSQSIREGAHRFYASLGYDRDAAFQKIL